MLRGGPTPSRILPRLEEGLRERQANGDRRSTEGSELREAAAVNEEPAGSTPDRDEPARPASMSGRAISTIALIAVATKIRSRSSTGERCRRKS